MTFPMLELLISPVLIPRMTMDELWLPALPPVPVSMVRKRARNTFCAISSSYCESTSELRDCMNMSTVKTELRRRMSCVRGVPK